MDGNEIWEDILSKITTGDGLLSHADLYMLREKLPAVHQKKVAPHEHQAFAREWTEENPWLAVPSLLAAIPAYSAAKATGVVKNTRSPASMEEVILGYTGILEGLGLTASKAGFGKSTSTKKMGVEGKKPDRSKDPVRPKIPPNDGVRG